MSNKPDPKKAVYLKPNHRKRRRRNGHVGKLSDWVEHKSSCALDPWDVAIRVLRERGIPVD